MCKVRSLTLYNQQGVVLHAISCSTDIQGNDIYFYTQVKHCGG